MNIPRQSYWLFSVVMILAFAGWYPLTGLGVTFVLVQAVAVAVFAELQLTGLRKAAI